jgi:hypothetical protein
MLPSPIGTPRRCLAAGRRRQSSSLLGFPIEVACSQSCSSADASIASHPTGIGARRRRSCLDWNASQPFAKSDLIRTRERSSSWRRSPDVRGDRRRSLALNRRSACPGSTSHTSHDVCFESTNCRCGILPPSRDLTKDSRGNFAPQRTQQLSTVGLVTTYRRPPSLNRQPQTRAWTQEPRRGNRNQESGTRNRTGEAHRGTSDPEPRTSDLGTAPMNRHFSLRIAA